MYTTVWCYKIFEISKQTTTFCCVTVNLFFVLNTMNLKVFSLPTVRHRVSPNVPPCPVVVGPRHPRRIDTVYPTPIDPRTPRKTPK